MYQVYIAPVPDRRILVKCLIPRTGFAFGGYAAIDRKHMKWNWKLRWSVGWRRRSSTPDRPTHTAIGNGAAPERRARWPIVMALVFGGVMLAAGVLLFVSAHWDELSPFRRMALLVLAVGGFHLAGAFSLERLPRARHHAACRGHRGAGRGDRHGGTDFQYGGALARGGDVVGRGRHCRMAAASRLAARRAVGPPVSVVAGRRMDGGGRSPAGKAGG